MKLRFATKAALHLLVFVAGMGLIFVFSLCQEKMGIKRDLSLTIFLTVLLWILLSFVSPLIWAKCPHCRASLASLVWKNARFMARLFCVKKCPFCGKDI